MEINSDIRPLSDAELDATSGAFWTAVGGALLGWAVGKIADAISDDCDDKCVEKGKKAIGKIFPGAV